MPFSAPCPSCGAPVAFKSSASFHAVCEFCRSTLVRHGGALENLGRMADLLEDASPIRLGTEGRYKGVHFAVIGRIQLKYASGVWNEWHLLFDDMRSGWLSDAGGEYVVSFLTPPGGPLPEFKALMPNDTLSIAGREFIVSDLEEALCIAGEGELPFSFGSGYGAQLADLRSTGDDAPAFASIDYSEAPPLVFVGESLPFAGLHFANLRGENTTRSAGPVKTLQCPRCASAIGIHDPAVQSVACPACLTVLAPDNENLRILHKAATAMRVEPLLALGSVGRFDGLDWTVIGFQERGIHFEGEDWRWREYLLHHPEQGFRWLVESSGHWSWVSPVSNPPGYAVGLPTLSYRGEEYKRFSAGTAKTLFVIGEFTWKVRVGEEWELIDFVAPPKSLSRETSQNEVTWSQAEYLDPAAVAAAFRLDHALPEAQGVGMIQPNPRLDGHRSICSAFWKFAGLAVLAQALWVFIFGSQTVLDQRLLFSPAQDGPVTTAGFELPSGARRLVLRHETDLDNNWLGINSTLVEQKSGRAWVAINDVAYWQGYEDGEHWSEGDRSREMVFRDLPPGSYYLVIDPEISDEKPVPVRDRLRAERNPAPWSNFFFLLGFLALLPMFSRYRVGSFEAKRWADADFLSSGEEFGSDDDGDSDGGDD